jgi:hypothetical protein
MEDLLRDYAIDVYDVWPPAMALPFLVAGVAGWFAIKSWRDEHAVSPLAAIAIVIFIPASVAVVMGYAEAKDYCDSVVSPQERLHEVDWEEYRLYTAAQCDSIWPIALPSLPDTSITLSPFP